MSLLLSSRRASLHVLPSVTITTRCTTTGNSTRLLGRLQLQSIKNKRSTQYYLLTSVNLHSTPKKISLTAPFNFQSRQHLSQRHRLFTSSSASTTDAVAATTSKGPTTVSASATKASSSTTGTGSRTSRWIRIARLIKYTRIPFLILSVYGLGYQQGIIDYSRDPTQKEDDLLSSILAGIQCHDRTQVQIIKEGDFWKLNVTDTDPKLKNVATVGAKIIKVAKQYVEDEMKKVLADRVAKLPPELVEDEEKLYKLLSLDEEFTHWANASRRMSGKWSYLLINSPIPNAFVSEILPNRIFITTTMIDKFIDNDDEMGLVLGHEVSHLILGHVSRINTLETVLRTVEVLLLSLDPTEGILSLGVIATLATIRRAVGAAHSRENERDADTLGIKLAAMACYDTQSASNVFAKMALHSTESGADSAEKQGKSLMSFIDTHPPSKERHETLMKASLEENVSKYEDTTCQSIRTMIRDMLARKPPQSKKEDDGMVVEDELAPKEDVIVKSDAAVPVQFPPALA